MQDLPEELQEKIFLYLRQPEDLFRVCSTSSCQRRICSGSAFWKEKFVCQGLPMLEEGSSVTRWLQLYTKARRSAQLADEELVSLETKGVNLEDLPDLSYLPGLEETLQPYYDKVKSGGNIEHIIIQTRAVGQPLQEIKICDDYFVFLAPSDSGHRYEVTERRRITHDGVPTRDHSRAIYASPIMTSDQAWNILYRLFYSGILF
ncbi:F-box domain-containing protein [Brazilian cedratvirus IHUMI]|uniref:F-box domain-containing protein n=1 Tax=Brazilian cedratvirus IHUMI TaxID=2126980 RepID=A0A2R8FEQ5_9VIRU|nr:F-box domain-containing protein [Brazilian cedratvirus IHUMI]